MMFLQKLRNQIYSYYIKEVNNIYYITDIKNISLYNLHLFYGDGAFYIKILVLELKTRILIALYNLNFYIFILRLL